jgi:hypothetical protein
MENLTKKDKIIFGILLFLFIVPELIWGGVMREIYMWFKMQFLNEISSDVVTRQDEIFYSTVLLLETVGVASSVAFVFIKRKLFTGKTFWVILAPLFLLFLLSLVAYTLASIGAYMTVGLNAP